MRSKQILVLMLFSLIAIQGCGLLGNRADPSSILTYQSTNAGCLDNIGNQVKEYGNGQISANETNEAWNCVSGSLTLFTQFIRGSVPNGYTPDDIQIFISHFLFSKGTINMDLVRSVFALKASLFGGSADVLTIDEINNVLTFAGVLQKESIRILPFLTDRIQNPTPRHLLELSEAIKASGKNIAASLHTVANPTFTSAQIQTLISQVQLITLPTMSPVGQIGEFATSLKRFLAAGGTEGIEGSAWPVLVESLARYFGPALAAISYNSTYAIGVNAEDGFFKASLDQIAFALNGTIKVNGGSIPFSTITNLIQSIPESFLNSAQKTAIAGAQPMLFTHILQSTTPNAIDENVTKYLTQQVDTWDQAQKIIETIYSRNGFDVDKGATAAQLSTALSAYTNSPDAPTQAAIQWVSTLIQNYKPYFAASDAEISFSGLETISLHDISMKHLIRVISSVLLNGYSTGADKTQINFPDFSKFVDDVNPVLTAFQMEDPSIPGAAEARFLQANLFMPSSNGDSALSIDEGSQYILYFLSIYNQSQRVLPVVSNVCTSYGLDPFNTPYMNADCFRKNYFSNYLVFWNRMPLLTKYYQSLNAAERQTLEEAVEIGARRYGYSNQCVGFSDIEGFAGILHYIETILERFDVNGDGYMNTEESMAAFPLFQNELISVGTGHGLSATNVGQQKAVFAYALAHGALPKTNFLGDVDFLLWWIVLGQSHWNVKATRSSLYNVMATISPPPVPPTTSHCQ